MFLLHPPVVREATLFSSLPARYRDARRTDWSDANQGGRAIDSFLEGPVVDDAGNLYVSDIPNGRIFRIDAAGAWELVAEWDGEPNGMKFLGQHELLVTDYRNGLMRVDTRTGSVRPHLGRRNTESFKGVNDLTLDTRGNVYFTDQGQTGLHDPTGRVYRLTPEGRLDLLLHNVPSPNGIVLSPDERFLFVAVTRGNCVWRMPLQADGNVSKTGQFFTSHGPSGPDGLAMDQSGRLLVANPGLAYVWVLNHRAEPVEVIRGPAGHSLTNLAFGGADRKTLYITDSTAGAILSIGRLVNDTLPFAKMTGPVDSMTTCHILSARIALARGDRDLWQRRLLELEELGGQMPSPRAVCSAWLERARVATLDGALDAAAQALRAAEQHGAWEALDDAGYGNEVDIPAVARWRLDIARGQHRTASVALAGAIAVAVAQQRHWRLLKLRLLHAMALDGAAQADTALDTLTDALRLASHEGLVRSFLDEGPALVVLLQRWQQARGAASQAHGVAPGFVPGLLARMGAGATAAAPPPTTPDAGPDALTLRERDVVQMLSHGHRNRAIAEKLFVSELTVKSHLRRISAKLGAQSRTEVVAIARQRGLLD